MRLGVRQHDAVLLERRRRRLGRGLLARSDVLAQRRLHEEVPERVGDAAEVRPRMLADRLDGGLEEDAVVLVAAEDLVRERDQPHGLVVRPVRQVCVERDPEASVRLLREHLALDEVAEAPRCVAVPRRDRAVVGEHAQERDPGPSAALHGRRVVADAVEARPRREREDRGREARRRPREPPAPGHRGDERHEGERQEDLVRGPDEDEARDARAERDEPPAGRALHRPREERAPSRRGRWRRSRRSTPGGRASRTPGTRGAGAR